MSTSAGKEFPEEMPATPLSVASIATMKSRLSDVLDPGQAAGAVGGFTNRYLMYKEQRGRLG